MLSRKVVLVLALCASVVLSASPSTAGEKSSSVTECDGLCIPCGHNMHFLQAVGTPMGEWWGYTFSCAEAPCPSKCQQIPGGGGDELVPIEAAVLEVERAVASMDASAIAHLVKADARFEFDASRDAILAIGCGNNVVSVVRLSEELIGVLTAN